MSPGAVNLPASPPRARAVPWRSVEYVALDFETTGLDLRSDTVISYGVVPVRHGRAIVAESVHQLIEPHVPPSPRSQTIHELRPQDLVGHPSLPEARDRLRTALDGRYLLVWFAGVEIHFLDAIFGGGKRRWRRRTVDVRNLAIAVDGGAGATRDKPGYPLTGTAERYGVPVADAHQALDDALVTAQLFLVLADKAARHPDPTVRELVRLGRP
jgi:DNA polymerase-3 subunit epsilon